MKRIASLLILLVFLTGQAPAIGQPESATGSRPRIGLALGGGAARGAAHVGVLRVLEEYGIPVDYVAGTSMGAVVGSLFALGLSADQIEAEIERVDWADLFSDRTRRQDRSMRRKEDDAATFFPLEFGLASDGLTTPRGFIAGQKFPFAFDAPGLLTDGHASFDDLPIPFRALATDLETGDRIVLDRGPLIRAVRASMSIPGVFPPVEQDGMLLVDGFLASNVPVDAVRNMGADIVIAVDVGRPPEDTPRDELVTLQGITLQAERIVEALSVRDESNRADILIHPPVEDWTGTEFDRMGEIIPLGEEGARQVRDQLEPLGVSEPEYRRWRESLRVDPFARPEIDIIVLDNRSRIDDRVVRRLVRQPIDAPLDLAGLERDLSEIYELGLVEVVDFDLQMVDQYEILNVTVHEKPYAPFIVHVGGAYAMGYRGASSFLLTARINYREVNRLGAEWRSDLAVGQHSGIDTEFYQPLDYARRWFVAGSLLADLRIDGYHDGSYTRGEYRYTRTGARLGAGVDVARLLEISAGLEVVNHDARPRTGTTPEPGTATVGAGPAARLRIDRLDDRRVPRSGVAGSVRWEGPRGWLGSTGVWDRIWGDLTVARSFGTTTVLGKIQGGSDLGTGMPYYRDFFLGGLRQLSGFRFDQLRGGAFAVGGLGIRQQLGGGGLPFASRYHLALWFDAGNAWDGPADAALSDLVYCGAISFILDTPLGPFELGYGLADTGDQAFHLNLGIHFASTAN